LNLHTVKKGFHPSRRSSRMERMNRSSRMSGGRVALSPDSNRIVGLSAWQPSDNLSVNFLRDQRRILRWDSV
jgi:hypothetical protein